MEIRNSILILRSSLAFVAIIFGIATLFAGGSVLLGSDPGYVVFRPLLIYNTLMGGAYFAGGVALWCNAKVGRAAAATIFLLNLFVLVGIFIVNRSGGAVAVDSLRAMSFRTVVWLALFLGAGRLARKRANVSG